MRTTTSPQQQNPKAGADKDPCEVLFSMLYPRLFTTKSHVLHDVFICHASVYHSCRAKLSAKQIPHQSLVLKDKVEHCCKEFSLRDISTTL